jgi:hypothetical protein
MHLDKSSWWNCWKTRIKRQIREKLDKSDTQYTKIYIMAKFQKKMCNPKAMEHLQMAEKWNLAPQKFISSKIFYSIGGSHLKMNTEMRIFFTIECKLQNMIKRRFSGWRKLCFIATQTYLTLKAVEMIHFRTI